MSRYQFFKRIGLSRSMPSLACLLATLAMLLWPAIVPASCCCVALQHQLQQLRSASIDGQTSSDAMSRVSATEASNTCPLCIAAACSPTAERQGADGASPRNDTPVPSLQGLCHCGTTPPLAVTVFFPSESFKQGLRLFSSGSSFLAAVTKLPHPQRMLVQRIYPAAWALPLKANQRLALRCSWLN